MSKYANSVLRPFGGEAIVQFGGIHPTIVVSTVNASGKGAN